MSIIYTGLALIVIVSFSTGLFLTIRERKRPKRIKYADSADVIFGSKSDTTVESSEKKEQLDSDKSLIEDKKSDIELL